MFRPPRWRSDRAYFSHAGDRGYLRSGQTKKKDKIRKVYDDDKNKDDDRQWTFDQESSLESPEILQL